MSSWPLSAYTCPTRSVSPPSLSPLSLGENGDGERGDRIACSIAAIFAALVYVAAFAPDAGESAASLGASGPPTRILEQIRPDAHGFFKLTRTGVDEVFAQDLTAGERALIFATQNPLAGAAFGGPITTPSWKEKPSFYLRATEDHTIHPDLQQTMASRINARTVAAVASSHLPMLSHPRAVADLIIAAAE